MTSQETRSKWETIRPAGYSGRLAPCRKCGKDPQLFVVDPAGLYIKAFMPGETFLAARCSCGNTGELKMTGKNVFGEYIDALRAGDLAAAAWNAEQV